jgi:hypothetical protein
MAAVALKISAAGADSRSRDGEGMSVFGLAVQ